MKTPPIVVFVVSSAVALAACGSSGGAPSSDGGAGGAGSDATAYSGTDSGSQLLVDASGSTPESDAASDALQACAATSQRAQQTPLELFLMIDESGSMSDLVAPNRSKWSAVVTALTSFMQDPASAGIGVSLGYFPQNVPGAPASCTSTTQCGAAGPCLLGECNDASGFVCGSDADCAPGVACAPLGACENNPNELCQNFGKPCGLDANNFDLGACSAGPLTSSSCVGGDSCTTATYATFAASGTLPAATPTLLASLSAQQPHGETPTTAALAGAITAAEKFGSTHPEYAVAVVLATDGTPDEMQDSTGLCTQADPVQANALVAQTAAQGLANNPSVRTYGIGVFAPDEVGPGTQTLQQIAQSGGTTSPFIVTVAPPADGGGATIADQLDQALARIRGMALPCEFRVPLPEAGTLDFGKINVTYTTSGGAAAAGSSTIGYVETSAACDPQKGGWYYDSDPLEGGVPSKIEICPATCSSLQSDPSAVVNVALGCKTVLLVR